MKTKISVIIRGVLFAIVGFFFSFLVNYILLFVSRIFRQEIGLPEIIVSIVVIFVTTIAFSLWGMRDNNSNEVKIDNRPSVNIKRIIIVMLSLISIFVIPYYLFSSITSGYEFGGIIEALVSIVFIFIGIIGLVYVSFDYKRNN